MNEQRVFDDLLAWFLDPATADEAAIRQRLTEVPATVWPSFSGEVAAELSERARQEAAGADMIALKRHLLGEERTRREASHDHHLR
jgi:hypothetical protein